MAAMSDSVGLFVDPLGTAMRRWRREGDVVRFRVAPMRAYLLAHPDDIRHVLHARRDIYGRDPLHAAALGRVSGAGLTASEGSLWHQQRELLRPYFQRRYRDGFTASAVARTDSLLTRWRRLAESEVPVDLSEEMLRLSLEAIADALFDADLEEESAAVVADAAVVLGALYRSMRFPIPWLSALTFSLDRRFGQARQALYQLADDLLARRSADRDEEDLLTLLTRRIASRQAADQVVTMILAGHDTTGAALTWALQLVARHPEVGHRLQVEAREAFDGRNGDGSPDLAKLPIAAAVFKETLRLYPPAWMISRSPSESDAVGGCVIPKDASVFISPFVTHRHPELWRRPERFEPDRFLHPDGGLHPYAYLPFGAGPRMCIGRALAEAVGQVVIAMIAGAVKLTPLRACRETSPSARLTLHPTPRLLANVTSL